MSPEFSAIEIEELIKELLNCKVISIPRYLEAGLGNENWLIETDKGNMLCKIGSTTFLNKWKGALMAVELALKNGVPTNNIIVFKDEIPGRRNKMIRVFSYIEGISVKSLLNNLILSRKYFTQLGIMTKRLHNIKLDYFSSRIDGSSCKFKRWSDYLHYRIPQIHARSKESGFFNINKLEVIWENIYQMLPAFDQLIYPVLTHRDLHLDNFMGTIY